MYPTYLSLHDRASGGMSTAEQREADAQLGQLAAAVSQLAGRIRAGAHGAADVLALAGYPSALFRKVDQRVHHTLGHVTGPGLRTVPEIIAKPSRGISPPPAPLTGGGLAEALVEGSHDPEGPVTGAARPRP